MAYTPKTGDYHGQTFGSEYQYRNRLAKDRGFPSYWQQRKYHAGRIHSIEVGFWNAEKQEGTYNFYHKTWLAGLDHRPRSWEAAKFDVFYNATKASDWNTAPNGELAIFLDYIGVRPLGKYRQWSVGDTPKA